MVSQSTVQRSLWEQKYDAIPQDANQPFCSLEIFIRFYFYDDFQLAKAALGWNLSINCGLLMFSLWGALLSFLSCACMMRVYGCTHSIFKYFQSLLTGTNGFLWESAHVRNGIWTHTSIQRTKSCFGGRSYLESGTSDYSGSVFGLFSLTTNGDSYQRG